MSEGIEENLPPRLIDDRMKHTRGKSLSQLDLNSNPVLAFNIDFGQKNWFFAHLVCAFNRLADHYILWKLFMVNLMLNPPKKPVKRRFFLVWERFKVIRIVRIAPCSACTHIHTSGVLNPPSLALWTNFSSLIFSLCDYFFYRQLNHSGLFCRVRFCILSQKTLTQYGIYIYTLYVFIQPIFYNLIKWC